jgi:hypothetical protein
VVRHKLQRKRTTNSLIFVFAMLLKYLIDRINLSLLIFVTFSFVLKKLVLSIKQASPGHVYLRT